MRVLPGNPTHFRSCRSHHFPPLFSDCVADDGAGADDAAGIANA